MHTSVRLRQSTYLQAALKLFQKSQLPDEASESVIESEDEAPDFSRIRCPLCLWRPVAESRWYCVNCAHPEYFFRACGTGWNTFTTRGLCPGCGHQWRWTACLFCHGWSLHQDWYEKETD
jgi:hypothetical protein